MLTDTLAESGGRLVRNTAYKYFGTAILKHVSLFMSIWSHRFIMCKKKSEIPTPTKIIAKEHGRREGRKIRGKRGELKIQGLRNDTGVHPRSISI